MTLASAAQSLLVGKSRIFEMNAGIFVRDGHAYLVDPGIFPDEIDALVRAVSDRAAHLRGIIVTHSHWDHILGPERIVGVPVIAHSSAAAHLLDERDEVSRLVAERLATHGANRETPFVAPQIAIQVGDTHDLAFAEGALRLLHAPGHCDDQIVIYEPLERTLWAADMLSDIEIPFIEDVKAYRVTLERLMPLDIATLVPGHGNLTSDPREIKERLEGDHHYLVELEAAVAGAVRDGRSLDQIQSALGDQPLRRPDINTQEHLRNIETVYRALSA